MLPRLVALASAAGIAFATPLAAAPNLLLVTLDTTRADRIGAWGAAAARTPRLDRLAKEGLRFARCDTAAPITLPSHATLLTGLLPPRHGVRDNGTFTLAPRFESVAERLAGAGYDTAAVVSAIVLARRHGLDQGFRLYDDDLGSGYAEGSEVAERTAEATTAAALAALAKLRPPFFLWVHYYDPHEEYRPPTRFVFAGEGRDRLYDGEIAYVDEQLGRLLDALPAATSIVVVGDHGEMLGEHGEATHGLLPFAAARRVPLLLAGSGVPAGEVSNCLARTADVAPTLLALAGMPPPIGLDGVDLLAPGRGCGRESYTESYLPFFAYGWYPLRTISDGRALFLQAPTPSLYRLDTDPGETTDLAPAEPQLVAWWRGRLQRLLGAAGEALEPEVHASSPLDEAAERQLAALGYLAGGAGGAVSGALPDPRQRTAVAARLHVAAGEIQQGKCPQVLRELRAIATEDPRNFPALCLAAECLRDAGRAADAIELFRRAATLQPRSPVPPANLGAALISLGRGEEGARELRRALALDPSDGVSASRLARYLLDAGKPAEALTVLDATRAAGGRLPQIFLERGAVLAQTGRLEEALADFREAARRAPQDPVAAENVARALFGLGRAREAALAYEALLRLAPERLDAWKTLGAIALEIDDRERALAAFRAALRLEPDAAERSRLEALIETLSR